MEQKLRAVQERLAALSAERKKMGEVIPNQPVSHSPTKNGREVRHPCSAVTLFQHHIWQRPHRTASAPASAVHGKTATVKAHDLPHHGLPLHGAGRRV